MERQNKNPYDLLHSERVYINSEVAIKPYYYLRNGLLHVRYVKDCCIELSNAESTKVKVDLTAQPFAKQKILADAWNFYTNCVEKPIIQDGIAEFEKRLKRQDDGHSGKSSNF